MDYELYFFVYDSESVLWYTLFIIYTRESFFILFLKYGIFPQDSRFSVQFPFFKYVTWRFSPCGRIYFFFCLDTKEEVTRRKNQGYVSGPTPERPFWLWKMNSLRCTALRQHFSEPPVHSYAHAPTTRPILFYAKALRCWLVSFRCCFMPYLFLIEFS